MKTANFENIVEILEDRFMKNIGRHEGLKWELVKEKIEANPNKLQVLIKMEKTGGEPDVIGKDEKTGEYLICDCSPETPIDRRSICYDKEALEARKNNKPNGNAIEMAAEIGIELLNEEEYRALQLLGEFDTKTSSWIKTPAEIRTRGGSLFGDRRYNHVFIYHNGADSYYSGRGFRGILKV